MDEEGRSRDRAGRRAKRFLTPMQKYEIYLQVLRGEVTMAEAAAAAGVDRTTVVRIRQVAKDGALAALAESRPGIKAGGRDFELDAAKAEIARLSETVKEMASAVNDCRGGEVQESKAMRQPTRDEFAELSKQVVQLQLERSLHRTLDFEPPQLCIQLGHGEVTANVKRVI